MTSATTLRENQGVLRYLGQGIDAASVPVQRPDDSTDTRRLGAHPDIVEHLWTELSVQLPDDCRCLVNGGAALAHPRSGLILAVALGTTYALRLTESDFEAARSVGYDTIHEYRSVNRTLDMERTFGPGWVFGRHGPEEAGWLAATYAAAAS